MGKSSCVGGRRDSVLGTLLLRPFVGRQVLTRISKRSLKMIGHSLGRLVGTSCLSSSVHPAIGTVARFGRGAPRQTVVLTTNFKVHVIPVGARVPGNLLRIGKRPLVRHVVGRLRRIKVGRVCMIINFVGRGCRCLVSRCNVRLMMGTSCTTGGGLRSIGLMGRRLRGTCVVPYSV